MPSIQAQLDDSPNASTDLCPNDVVYGFKGKETLSAINNNNNDLSEASSELRLLYRIRLIGELTLKPFNNLSFSFLYRCKETLHSYLKSLCLDMKVLLERS